MKYPFDLFHRKGSCGGKFRKSIFIFHKGTFTVLFQKSADKTAPLGIFCRIFFRKAGGIPDQTHGYSRFTFIGAGDIIILFKNG